MSFFGNRAFMAPEILEGEDTGKSIGWTNTDVFSMSALLLYICERYLIERKWNFKIIKYGEKEDVAT